MISFTYWWFRFQTSIALDRIFRRGRISWETIDSAVFAAAIPSETRFATRTKVLESLHKSDNLWFFANLGECDNRHRSLPKGITTFDDLFPPNIAVIDFLLRKISNRESEVVLDYGCGIGVLIVYLSRLGFDVSGFDNWREVSKSTAEGFLSACGIAGRILDEDELCARLYTILTCIGLPWNWATAVGRLLELPSLKYILVDRKYRPNNIPHFERVAEYPALLTVFRRID
ncbi:MAG: class I SAM-dependent methyltransferase [Chloroflexi bacterium]|nr:class I SAM-dependent methyltransferase [Chloroflexota bacterium]